MRFNLLNEQSTKNNNMRKPGFEPGSQPWQGRILTTGPLAQFEKQACEHSPQAAQWARPDSNW